MNKILFPLAKQTITSDELVLLGDWLKTNPKLTQGTLVKEFEQKWADYIGTKYAVFVNSGSSANLLMTYAAILHNNIKNIIVPSVGWATTIAPALQFNLHPYMVEADKNTFGLNLNNVEDLCKKEKIDAVIFVHVLGVPHSRKILELKNKYNFILLEDACAALGSKYSDNTMTGTVGDMSTFSFYFGHQLSTIEGGMINTNNLELYRLLLMLRSHGWGKDLDKEYYEQIMNEYNIDLFHQPFTFFVPGFNVRGTDLQAFIGLRQLEKAEWVSLKRFEHHIQYANNLKKYFNLQNYGNDSPASISFGALAESPEHRKNIVKKLEMLGIETRLFSAGNLGLHPFWYKNNDKFSAPIANLIHSNGFFLPNYPELESQDINYISQSII